MPSSGLESLNKITDSSFAPKATKPSGTSGYLYILWSWDGTEMSVNLEDKIFMGVFTSKRKAADIIRSFAPHLQFSDNGALKEEGIRIKPYNHMGIERVAKNKCVVMGIPPFHLYPDFGANSEYQDKGEQEGDD